MATKYVYTKKRPGGFGTGCGGVLIALTVVAVAWWLFDGLLHVVGL